MDKEYLKAHGIDCRWENSWECPYYKFIGDKDEMDCIEFGECVYLGDDEDRCL